MSSAAYDRVRFIGYAIPTTPADIIAFGDQSGRGAMAGTYRAADDLAADVRGRAAVMRAAVDLARDALPDLGDPSVLNVFVAPEFFWHGPVGPYVSAPGERDAAEIILDVLRELFPAPQYPHFLLVLGSVVTTEVADIAAVVESVDARTRTDIVRHLGEGVQRSAGVMRGVIFDMLADFIRSAHAYPLVRVRNRALMISATPVDGILSPLGAEAFTTQKHYDSNEDFLLWEVTGKPVITEPMAAYAGLDLSAGDFKAHAADPYGIFAVRGDRSPVNVAVEVCLDHADRRLRKSSARSPWPRPTDGLDLHLVPSCGMQLHPPAVAARAGGWAFNCDGRYPLGNLGTEGVRRQGFVAGVECVYADYIDSASPAHGAHTQLARVRTGARLSDENAPGAMDATFTPPPEVTLDILPVPRTDDIDALFAGGGGAVHIYGRSEPMPLRY
ncbi:hypothetical protein NQ156_06385 [Microbacterium sp. zg.Y625]|uniref:hypothetical protein n=1 Tax=Microbacterium jiangjiandongii TaxID=3049071 RepID=UPI00214CADF6|nr:MULTISPECIES: hypothetical protein [unclassified Microbacterium]MCR2792692.1 hypothetical protein [Microbacterium sp. zg.Y625]WIM26671.1 hypothetical protein QNO14_06410 [Microbacterium sp. zg-Y625]